MRVASAIELSDVQHETLARLAQSNTTQVWLARRASIARPRGHGNARGVSLA